MIALVYSPVAACASPLTANAMKLGFRFVDRCDRCERGFAEEEGEACSGVEGVEGVACS